MFPQGYRLGFGQVIYKGEPRFKSPMYIVGCQSYLNQKIDYKVKEEYDIHLFFCPTNDFYYRVTLLLYPKDSTQLYCTFINRESKDIKVALEQVINGVNYNSVNRYNYSLKTKQDIWLTNAIYRCPKISFKDVMHLEPYKEKEVA